MENLLELIESAEPEDLKIISQRVNKRQNYLFYLSLPEKRFEDNGINEIKQAYRHNARSDDPAFDVSRVKSSGCVFEWDAYYDNGKGIFIHVYFSLDFTGRDGETMINVDVDGKRCE
jgi:hypothetical protein